MKKVKSNKNIIYWIPVILIMVLIFIFSHQPANQSAALSSGITEIIIEMVENVIPNTQLDIRSMNHLVRKNAHFFIYLLLGVLVMRALRKNGVDGIRGMGYAALICILYAISDEIHQLFVPGRSGEILDVIIDSVGAVIGIVSYRLLVNRARS